MIISLVFAIFIFVIPYFNHILADEEYKFEMMWPALQQPWYFNYNTALAIYPSGEIYIADGVNPRIQKFTTKR